MTPRRPRQQVHPQVDQPRICVIGSGWRFTSGISYYTCRVTSALAARHDVSVILMRTLIPRRLYPGRDRVGLRVHNIDYPAQVPVFDGVDWFALPSLVRAVRFLRQQRPNVVIFQWWTGAVLHSYVVLAWAARRLGATVIIEFHELQDTGEARTRGVARYVSVAGHRFLSGADGYLVHSDHDREAISRAFPIAEAPVRVVPHGPFDHVSPPHSETDTVEDADTEGPLRLLFFGTIRPYKGLEHLVEAFNSLEPADAERFELAVVGETWEGWTRPLRLIDASPYRHRIQLTNRYVTDREIADAFGGADAVVLPYTRSSASGPLHIAMAHGLPVVLSDVGGLRSGAEGYDGVTWVPPADPAALRLALLGLHDQRGQRFPDPRSWDDTVATLHSLLEALGP